MSRPGQNGPWSRQLYQLYSARFQSRGALEQANDERQDEDIDQRGCRDLTDIDDDEPRLVNELLATSPGNIRARQFHQSALVLLAPLYQWLSVMQPAQGCAGHKPRRVAPGRGNFGTKVKWCIRSGVQRLQLLQNRLTHLRRIHRRGALRLDVGGAQAFCQHRRNGGIELVGQLAHVERIAQRHSE